MKRIRGLEKWILEVTSQPEWIHQELVKHQIITHPFIPHFELQKDFYGKILRDASTHVSRCKSIGEIRKNWSRYKYNSNNQNKTITFTLHPKTIKDLDQLRKGRSRREVLEQLISHGNDLTKELTKAMKSKLEVKKEELEARWPKRQALLPDEQILIMSDLKELKQTSRKQQEILEAVLFENAQLKILSKNLEGTKHNDNLNKKEVLTYFEEAKDYYANEIRSSKLLPRKRS